MKFLNFIHAAAIPFLRQTLVLLGLAASVWSGYGAVNAGSAVRLSGADQYVVSPNLRPFFADETVTIELWFKADRDGVLIYDRGVLPPAESFQYGVLAVSPVGDVWWQFSGLGYFNIGTISFGQWHHAAVRYDKTTKVGDGFIDGVRTLRASYGDRFATWESSGIASDYFGFGMGGSSAVGSTASLQGEIDEVRIWNVARSDAQILAGMNKTLSGLEAGLVAYWRFDEAGGTTTADLSGNGNDGVLANGATWTASGAGLTISRVTAFQPISTEETSTILSGAAHPDGRSSRGWFEWGYSTNYGQRTLTQSIGAGTSFVPLMANLSGLVPGSTWHYRAAVSNETGVSYSDDQSFRTVSLPAVVPGPVSGVTPNTATLNATVNPYGFATVAWFEYGVTASYGQQSARVTVGNGSTPVALAEAVSGLAAGGTYHFRVGISNSLGASYSPDRFFYTEGAVPATSLGFDGVDDFFLYPGLAGPSVTIELWVYAVSSGTMVVESSGGGWGTTAAVEIRSSGEVRVGLKNFLEQASLGFVSFGTWHHVALRFDISRATLDGLLDGQRSAPIYGIHGYPRTLVIGGFSGRLADVRIRTVARTDEEIQANLNRTLTGSQPGLQVNWLFTEQSGLVAHDASGHEGNVTLVNGPVWYPSGTSSTPPPVVYRGTVERLPNGNVKVHFDVPPNRTAILQSTTTFSSWTNVLSQAIGTNGVLDFVDTNARFTQQRFYRTYSP